MWYTKAVFTLGRDMISLTTNETCFVMKNVNKKVESAYLKHGYSFPEE